MTAAAVADCTGPAVRQRHTCRRDLGDRGYQVILQLSGIGPRLAAVIIAEIGEVSRFRNTG